MITYNHEKFIAQAIESVLSQETTFPFEIVIGEDCSTDRTREISLEFQARYPEIVRVLTPEANLGVGRNVAESLRACRGEYIAICEGDDFWTDPTKLTKQVKRLETEPDAALCFHKVTAINDVTGEYRGDFPVAEFRKERATLNDIIRKNFIVTCSVLFRRKAQPELNDGFETLKIGDWALFLLLTLKGPAVYIDETMATYRIHGGGVWTSGTLYSRTTEIVRTLEYVLPKLSGKDKLQLKSILSRFCLRVSRDALRVDNRSIAQKYIFKSLFYHVASRNFAMMQYVRYLGKMYLPAMASAFRIMKHHL